MDKRSQIQKEAYESWTKMPGLVGTCELPTGLGKTFVALRAIQHFPKNNGDLHLFLAEVKTREKDLEEQIIKYNEIFGTDLRKDYQIKFACYQAAYRWKNKSFGLVIADRFCPFMW
jgi:superfamily II DNA or RNA helicase